MCMCVSLFYVVYYSLLEGLGGGIQALNFTEWISLLPSNLVKEINPNPEALFHKSQFLLIASTHCLP